MCQIFLEINSDKTVAQLIIMISVHLQALHSIKKKLLQKYCFRKLLCKISH